MLDVKQEDRQLRIEKTNFIRKKYTSRALSKSTKNKENADLNYRQSHQLQTFPCEEKCHFTRRKGKINSAADVIAIYRYQNPRFEQFFSRLLSPE